MFHYPFLVCTVVMTLTMVCAASPAQTPDWENPAVIGDNKLPPHATLIPFPSVDQALHGSGVSPTDSNFDFNTRIQATEGELLDPWGRSPSWAMAQLGLLPHCGFLALFRDVVVCQRAKHDSIAAYSTARAQRPHADARR